MLQLLPVTVHAKNHFIQCLMWVWPCLLAPVLFAIVRHKCLLKLIQPHFYPLEASMCVWSQTTVLTVCSSYLMLASDFRKNTSTCLYTHPADNWQWSCHCYTDFQRHICKNLSGRGIFQDHLHFLPGNKAEYTIFNIDTRNTSVYSQTSLSRKSSNWNALRKKLYCVCGVQGG